MKNQLLKRLAQLQAEYAAAEKILADLNTQIQNQQNTLLRISGAIQTLEELLEQDSGENIKKNRLKR
jgi:uncharacterized coiled-coil protein SlyX